MVRFVIEIKNWEYEDGLEFPLLVVAGSYDWSPGNRRRGHPDTWTPGWTELEVNAVTDGGGRALPRAVVEHLKDDESFMDAVEKAVTKRKYP